MSDELKSAIAESLPADGSSESSAETTGNPVAPAETPAQQVEQENVPFHLHPRFQEVIKDRDEAREFARQAMDALKKAQERPVMAPQAPQDEYQGLDEEQRRLAQFVDQRAEIKARRIVEQTRPEIESAFVQTREALAMVAYQRFMEQHPDVKQGSPEENAIAAKVKQGYNLDDAYKTVMFDTLIAKKGQQQQQQQQIKTQQKIQANLETSSIPANSAIKPQANKSFRELMADQLKGWSP